MRVRSHIPSSLLLGAVVVAGGISRAEEPRLQRQVEKERQSTIDAQQPALSETALIDYGAYLQATWFSLQDAQADTHVLRELDAIGYARLGIDRHQEIFFRGRASVMDFAQGDSFNGEGDYQQTRLERLFYSFVWQADGVTENRRKPVSMSAQFGRQFVYWGEGLELAATIDGVLAEFNAGPIGLNLLAGVTAPWVIDFDSSRPDFDSHTRRAWYGAMFSIYQERHHIYAYGLFQEDMSDSDQLQIGPIDTHFGYDSHYLGLGANGALGDRISYRVEGVWESGAGLSNSFRVVPGGGAIPISQTSEEVDAWAASLRVDYLPPGPRRARLTAGLTIASGDPDRRQTGNTFAGNTPGTDDHAFNGQGAVNTGLVFAPVLSNLVVGHAGVSLFPLSAETGRGRLSRLQCGMDLFAYFKQDSSAPVEDFTTNGRFLGWETDLFVNWPILEDLSIFVRYGVFLPSDLFPVDELRQAWYVGAVYAF
jgi:hypothetical protein